MALIEPPAFTATFARCRQPDGAEPDWLRELRRSAWERFSREGFPTVKDEEWQYTRLAPLLEVEFSLAAGAGIAADALAPHRLEAEAEIVFVDGRFAPALSRLERLPEGIEVADLATVFSSRAELLRPLMTRAATAAEGVFPALNQAFAHSGAWVHVDARAPAAAMIHILHVATGGRQPLASFPRNVIVVGENSRLRVVESYAALAAGVYFTGAMTDILVGENAAVEHCKLQLESPRAFHFAVTRIRQQRSSRLSTFNFDRGGRLARNNLDIRLDGSGSATRLDGLYAVRGEQHVDNHTCVRHDRPQCESSQLYKGILNDRARAVFAGRILVAREAQQTNAYQLNKNLLLSEAAEADTKPQLEIRADDVRCTHGATVGPLRAEERFYLESRGISPQKTETMLARGFANDVLSQLENEVARERIDQELAAYFPGE